MPSRPQGPPTHATERESRQVAEAAREAEWTRRSFAKGLFDGRVQLGLLEKIPAPDPEQERRARAFLDRLEAFARDQIDGDRIDREGRVPQEVLDGLAEVGAFGVKIPEEYGGLGLSQRTYARALEIVGSRCGSTAAFLSAHQSIGVPQPLILFGTEEQKRKYLPRCASGALSAFALTEPEVGSDPANMSTTAVPTEDGSAYILNGEKLWITNGPRADVLVVMARTPPRGDAAGRRGDPSSSGDEAARKRWPISAFIVETDWEGFEIAHLCDFMGLHGISNGVLRFDDVRVPRENLLWEEGKGLKLALVTLNTGRLSLPVFCSAAGKLCVEISRKWAAERVQWGQPIGKHDAIAQMIGGMAADTFAIDSIVKVTSGMADAKELDIRLEAAIAKLWNSERAWEIANDTLQIRGGRGYETADSLRARGETPYPVERIVRDLRINRIFEGSSEIMRLFIAREAVDEHLKIAGALVDPDASLGAKLGGALRAALHYAWWYPTRFIGGKGAKARRFGKLSGHVRYVNRTSRRLARSLFHQMVRYGPRLEKKQAVLGRLVDIGTELFVMCAVIVRAEELRREGERADEARELADLFCRRARIRIERLFDGLHWNADDQTYGLARRTLDGRYAWIEEGTIPASDEAPAEPSAPGSAEAGLDTTPDRVPAGRDREPPVSVPVDRGEGGV